jgi:hypothetical protein
MDRKKRGGRLHTEVIEDVKKKTVRASLRAKFDLPVACL